MERHVLWCPTGIYTQSFTIPYAIMRPILLFGRLGHCQQVDDTIIYTVNEKESLETSLLMLFGWFNNNIMKANTDKNYFVMGCT